MPGGNKEEIVTSDEYNIDTVWIGHHEFYFFSTSSLKFGSKYTILHTEALI